MTSTKVSRVIKASRKAVYRALTDPGALAAWRVPDDMTAEMHAFDLRPGGRYRMSLTYTDPKGRPGKTTANTDTFEGRFVELVPDERVVEAVVFEADDTKFAGEMTLTTSLADIDGGTLVTMVHENLPAGIRPEDNELGTSMALSKLGALLA
ncbi:MAG TPA: SRPBCC family protein [Alphaproteobacteria bacterium]|nr:SRPBCC family protein [Alphaproteobacteria bacterium]